MRDGREKRKAGGTRRGRRPSSSDNPAGLMKDYTEFVSKYADWGKKIDDIDEDSLSKADYDYYIDVTARVTKKLAEVAE